ncbi:fungal hydrophobin [Paxillus involutus ATCC 200175]|uniref:Hydrophobin n=1 Tax=Paxillus involutus ATCC 200175 TaxID=664439 RepID=A0A0C9U9J8_PAXIN|nr:fungal hydrophobin [Paxillus involutus ATCC 200175]
MFIRASTLVHLLVGFAAIASAAPGSQALVARGNQAQCNTGPIQCCNQLFTAGSETATLLGLGDVLAGITGLVGTSCTPITVIGLGSGSDCMQQPVCCNGNTQNGLINIGCSPINL